MRGKRGLVISFEESNFDISLGPFKNKCLKWCVKVIFSSEHVIWPFWTQKHRLKHWGWSKIWFTFPILRLSLQSILVFNNSNLFCKIFLSYYFVCHHLCCQAVSKVFSVLQKFKPYTSKLHLNYIIIKYIIYNAYKFYSAFTLCYKDSYKYWDSDSSEIIILSSQSHWN